MLFAPMPYRLSRVRTNSSTIAALFAFGLRVTDLLGLAVAGLVAYWLRFGWVDVSQVYEQHIARSMLIAMLVFGMSPIYRSWRGRGLAGELWTMLIAYTAIFILAVLYTVAFKLTPDISRMWWGVWFVGAVAIGSTARFVIRGADRYARKHGFDLRTAVIVGGTDEAINAVARLQRNPRTGIRVVGWFATESCKVLHTRVPRLGTLEQLAGYVQANRINQVWVVLPLSAQAQIAEILQLLAHSTADVKFVPDLLGLQLLNHSVEQVAGLPVVNLRASPLDGDARLIKAAEDRLLSLAILLLIAPLMVLIALGIKLTSRGPVLFRQKRHGLDGKVIEVWKFRSMRVHREGRGQVTQASRHDPRITPLGRFLRRTSLDELPQFFNVLQGTMSIVGPRPHAVAHNHHYKTQVDDYMQRHRVKPGITGWAQVNGLRGETDTVDKMAARVEYDLHYMQNWSLLLDLKIIVMTVLKGFLGKNAY